jgi:Flp pilus assembly pilin Flp
MRNFVKRFIGEERGLEMVEWAIVAVLITTAGAITMRLIGVFVNFQYNVIWATLQRAG